MGDLKLEMTIDMRLGEYGIRPATVLGREAGEPFVIGDALDLVKYDSDGRTHYTIAQWRAGGEGYDFESIGNRFFNEFDSCEIATMWPFLQAVQEILDGLWAVVGRN